MKTGLSNLFENKKFGTANYSIYLCPWLEDSESAWGQIFLVGARPLQGVVRFRGEIHFISENF